VLQAAYRLTPGFRRIGLPSPTALL